jgi:long-chain acyl-CoA synthetase
MLYDRWRQIVRNQRRDVALIDALSGQRWRFQDLAREAEHGEVGGGPVFPKGISPEFILAVLRAWRSGEVACPVEQGQTPPQGLANAPAGCVHMKTTSASTGIPKLIAFTAEQLAADSDQIVATMGLRRDWPNLGVISLAHSYGFSNLVLPLLLHGIPLILVKAPLPETVRLAARLAPEITVAAVPALWRAWLGAAAIPANIRLAISAGAALPLALEQEVYRHCDLKIHNFYGASECGGIAYDRSGRPREDATCAGSPMEGVSVALNAEACLRVRSAAVGMTYWPVQEEGLADGQYQTSDLAELRDGNVSLRGRRSDMINVAGRKVSPESIEQALAAHPKVTDCVVFGVPSSEVERGETIVACVRLSSRMGVEELREYLLAQLPAWQLPRDWWFVPTLPANTRGKHSRAQWRQEYLEARAAQGNSSARKLQ